MGQINFPVTARKIGPSSVNDLSIPRVFYLSDEDIKKIIPRRSSAKGGCVIFLNNTKAGNKIETWESADEIRVARAASNIAAATVDLYVAQHITPAMTGVSGGITTTNVITSYLNRYVSGSGISACVRLPAPSDRNAVVIINGTSVPVSVFPNGASGFIDNGASGASKLLPAWKRMHLVTDPTTTAGASARWKSALDKQMNAVSTI